MLAEIHAPDCRLVANRKLRINPRIARIICPRNPRHFRGVSIASVNLDNCPENSRAASLRKRDVLEFMCATVVFDFRKLMWPRRALARDLSHVYTDNVRMFRLSYPYGWEQVSKSGAALLLRDPKDKSTQIGVTVTPIKILSLSAFGTLHEIGEKLIKAEESKDTSVPGGALLIREHERIGTLSGLTFYDYEYQLTTTHGTKRVISSVVVENSNLFIMNVQTLRGQNDQILNTQESDLNTDFVNTFDVGPWVVAQP